MKVIPLGVFVVASGVTGFAAGADPEVSPPPASFDDDSLVPFAPRRIKVGMSRTEVVKFMHGPPHEKAASDVWIYWDFRGYKCPAGMEKPALIIFFRVERVSHIRISDANLVRKTLSQYVRPATK